MDPQNPYTSVFIQRAKKRTENHALGGGSPSSTKSVWQKKGHDSRVAYYEHTLGLGDFAHTSFVYRDYLASQGVRPTIDAATAAAQKAEEDRVVAEKQAAIAAVEEAERLAQEAREEEERLRRELEAKTKTNLLNHP